MANAEQSVSSQASSGLARVSFAAAGIGVVLFGAGWLSIAWFGDERIVAPLMFWSVLLAYCAMLVGAVYGVRAVREARRQGQPRVFGLAAGALSFTFLVLLTPLVLWNLLFFVCDCVSP